MWIASTVSGSYVTISIAEVSDGTEWLTHGRQQWIHRTSSNWHPVKRVFLIPTVGRRVELRYSANNFQPAVPSYLEKSGIEYLVTRRYVPESASCRKSNHSLRQSSEQQNFLFFRGYVFRIDSVHHRVPTRYNSRYAAAVRQTDVIVGSHSTMLSLR
jgi:hypothetical protein